MADAPAVQREQTSRRARLIAAAAQQWRDPHSAVRRAARAALASADWSQPVIETALDGVLADLDEDLADKLIRAYSTDTSVRALVVLPGNIVGPAVACAFCVACAGATATLKVSHAERGLAGVVGAQFDALGPPLRASIEARYWEGGDAAVEAAVLAAVDRIVAFGDDETIADIARRRPADVALVAYGRAYSVGFVRAHADLRGAAAGAAQDICMFDQRGCMSPQTIYVEGDQARTLRFARLLAEAISAHSRLLPRAKPWLEEAAALSGLLRRLAVNALDAGGAQLDGVILGPQVEGCPQFAVVAQAYGPPTCAGFGRVAVVKPCTDARQLSQALRASPWKLETVGIAGSCDLEPEIATARPSRVCALGAMQRPPFGYRPRVADFAGPAA
ncbi:MAG: hypothetical protein M3T49_00815 [Candidatus Eremiobacteraeota bacterium]|nr:hypothetical protein [Candidatus Eremiobacteraeota bacterium]